MKTLLSATQHRAEAERLLSAASHQSSEKNFTPYGMTPEVASLIVARAQVHATLAASSGPGDAIEMARLLDTIAAGVRHGLTSDIREIRRFAESLRDSLAEAGFDLVPLMRGQSSWDGRGPHHAMACGVIIPLGHQYVDRSGVVWEDAGEWVYDHHPLMAMADERPSTTLRLDALLCTRGPLRSAQDGTVYTPAVDADGFDPTGYPGVFDALAKTWTESSRGYGKPGQVWDLTCSYVDTAEDVWTWQGGFNVADGEPELVGPTASFPISVVTAMGNEICPLDEAARNGLAAEAAR